MRILIAGASGAIGRPLVRRLRANRHAVFALARSPNSASALKEIGAEPVIADALDAAAVKAAVGRIRPDAVINELTSLPRHYTPAEMKAAAERDHKIRLEGNINLLAALRDAGVHRYLLQSSGFWYAPGAGLADESVPFISSASPGVEASAGTYLELEARASATPGIEFVALRYGFFYGPGTWYTREGDIGDQVRQQQVPIIGEGQGVYSFVHIDDAAEATAAALECPPGAYNVVDGNPSPQHLWLTAFARAAGAPAPPRVSEEEALRTSGPTRSTTRQGSGALRTRKPGASSGSVRARSSGSRLTRGKGREVRVGRGCARPRRGDVPRAHQIPPSPPPKPPSLEPLLLKPLSPGASRAGWTGRKGASHRAERAPDIADEVVHVEAPVRGRAGIRVGRRRVDAVDPMLATITDDSDTV